MEFIELCSCIFFCRRLEILDEIMDSASAWFFQADEVEKYRNCQRMSLGSFSRYMTEKHDGNIVDKSGIGSDIFIFRRI